MKKSSYLRCAAALFAGLCSGTLLAQSSGEQADSSSAGTPQSTVSNIDDMAQTTRDVSSQESQYAPALNGTGLISMNDVGKRLLISTTAGGGWDSNPSNATDGGSSGLYSVSPYIGFRGSSPKTQYIVQYQPTILGYMSKLYTKQTLHRSSASFIGNPSERWKWGVNVSGSYGPNGTRLLASQQTVAVGEVPGTGSGSASYLSNAGNITYIVGSVDLSYRKSEKETLVLSGSNSFSGISGFNQQGSVAGVKLSYIRDLSPVLSFTSYGQVSHFYGDLNCESSGVGGGLRWQPRERTFLSVSGGPQISTHACSNQQLGFTYSVAFSSRVSRKSQFYLLSDYLPTVSYLGPGLWQRSASGGYQYQVTRIGVLGADAGYVSSDTLTAVSSYRGTFWGVNYGFRLHHGIAVSYSYRGYVTDTGETSYKRNLAQFSVTWTHNAGQVFQQASY
jgi:hypothetical protein